MSACNPTQLYKDACNSGFACLSGQAQRAVLLQLLCNVKGGSAPADPSLLLFTDSTLAELAYKVDAPASGNITTISLPNLVSSTGTQIGLAFSGSAITSFSAPLLAHIFRSLELADTSISSISLPSLIDTGNLYCTGNSLLTSISAPLCTQCWNIVITGCPNFSSFVLGAFDTEGISITGTILTSFDISSVVGPILFDMSGNPLLTSIVFPAVPLFVDGHAITCADCALDAASVNAFLAVCVASGLATATISCAGGTNAAPTGQGLIDKAALIAAGNTVFTN